LKCYERLTPLSNGDRDVEIPQGIPISSISVFENACIVGDAACSVFVVSMPSPAAEGDGDPQPQTDTQDHPSGGLGPLPARDDDQDEPKIHDAPEELGRDDAIVIEEQDLHDENHSAVSDEVREESKKDVQQDEGEQAKVDEEEVEVSANDAVLLQQTTANSVPLEAAESNIESDAHDQTEKSPDEASEDFPKPAPVFDDPVGEDEDDESENVQQIELEAEAPDAKVGEIVHTVTQPQSPDSSPREATTAPEVGEEAGIATPKLQHDEDVDNGGDNIVFCCC
jgi:hypothetical protein